MTLGTRIAVMRDGRLEQVDAPLGVFRRPANLFVAGFVGSPAMNFWAEGDGLTVAAAPSSVLGIRPHDIELTESSDADGRGRIEVVEPLGAWTLIHLRVDRRSSDLVRVVIASDRAAGVGDVVGFRLRRDRIHRFDGETGHRCDG